jgi:hypothetical protein
MTKSLRHRCRNPRCRLKLKVPVENEHQAFCCRGCHVSFYRSRCLVCEEQMNRKTEQQRFKSGHAICRAEYQRFPHVYAWEPPIPTKCEQDARSAHLAGIESRISPTHRCLRELGWNTIAGVIG